MNFPFSRLLGSMLSVLVVAGFSSCKDDEPTSSKQPLLVDKTWVVVKYEMNGVDITDEQEECETDDATNFYSDGTYLEDVGALTCDEFDTDVDGTWSFKANETVLSITQAGEGPSDWNILELSENTLKISQYVPLFEADVVVTMTPE